MQTFLPYPNFKASLTILDSKRLGKQRVEALQILRTLRGESTGWINHPATKMWRGYDAALQLYLHYSIEIWKERGYKNTMVCPPPALIITPNWFGNEKFHLSHQSNLLRKKPDYYSSIPGWITDPTLPYFWPK